MTGTIGARVREGLRRVNMTQRQLAERVEMTEDAMSNALNGKRSFAAGELVRIAPLIETSVDWLVTGAHGRFEPKLSARHAYVDGLGHAEHDWARAKEAVADVVLAYQQVGFEGTPVPVTDERIAGQAAQAARRHLVAVAGGRFVEDLPAAVEAAFGVHVFVLPPRQVVRGTGPLAPLFAEMDSDHAYAGEVNGQQFIAVSSGGAWYRKNFAIAHELGHLLAGDPRHVDQAGDARFQEPWANAFASELLMPTDALLAVDWAALNEAGVVRLLLQFGVSTHALRVAVSIRVSNAASRQVAALREGTHPLMRRHEAQRLEELERSYLSRRFPQSLKDAHERAVNEAGLASGVLAWMLDVPIEDLQGDVDDVLDAPVDELAAALGLA